MNINTPTEGDRSTPMVVAIINGQYDLAMGFLARGANPNLASDDGVAPLFAALNNEWALRTWYPQPTAGAQQRASYLQLMEALLKAGADPERADAVAHLVRGVQHRPDGRRVHRRDAVLARRLRARRGRDAPARALRRRPEHSDDVVRTRRGARTTGPACRRRRPAARTCRRSTPRAASATARRAWPSSIVTCPTAGCRRRSISSRSSASTSTCATPTGFTALHHAAARGDNAMILYLVKRGADVMAVNRAGQTTVDMANSPEQRTQPFPETIKLLEGMGAKNNNNCRACK